MADSNPITFGTAMNDGGLEALAQAEILPDGTIHFTTVLLEPEPAR